MHHSGSSNSLQAIIEKEFLREQFQNSGNCSCSQTDEKNEKWDGECGETVSHTCSEGTSTPTVVSYSYQIL